MSRVRIAVLVGLFLAPWVFLIGVGSYHLWANGWLFAAWWPMFLSFSLAYILGWRWTRRSRLPSIEETPANYWTDRDKTAWEKVDAKARSFTEITTEQLADPRHYSELALDLAGQVARVYYPDGAGPFDHLTLPEVLACIELAAADLDELVQKYVPGSHMICVRDLKRARQAVNWYGVGQNSYWAASMLLNPLQVGLRWAASRYGLGTLFEKLQGNILLWFHTAFVQHLGRYLIEMNSGRLRVGAKRYREIMDRHGEPPVDPGPPPEGAAEPPPAASEYHTITIAVLGTVKAGKSSLVNALIGQQAALADALPVPHVGIRYRMTFPGGQPLALIDTAGYGQEGANESEFAAAAEAARDADLVLFVTSATNPGRRPDIDLLDRLAAWFAERPELKRPPVLAAVNQVDLLTPKAEWNPPYDWREGSRPKEATIRDCVAAVKEQLGDRAIDAVPVCARPGETFGIVEGLIPALALQLDEARGSAMLRAFHAEGQADQFRRLRKQLVQGGKKALGILWENWKKK